MHCAQNLNVHLIIGNETKIADQDYIDSLPIAGKR